MESLISVYTLSDYYEYAGIKLKPPLQIVYFGGVKNGKFDIFSGVNLLTLNDHTHAHISTVTCMI